MCTKQIEYHFSPLRGGYTFQATHAKSWESEMNIYTTITHYTNKNKYSFQYNHSVSSFLDLHYKVVQGHLVSLEQSPLKL